jgi:hypothetical protein
MKGRRSNALQPGHESGAVLAVGLILLAVVTILAVSAMATAVEERWLSGNHQFVEEALACAEAGLAEAIAVAPLSADPAQLAARYLDPAAPNPVPRRGSGTAVSSCPAESLLSEARSEYFLRFAELTPLPDPDADPALREWHFVVDSYGTGARGASVGLQAGFYVIAAGDLAQPPCRPGANACANPVVAGPVRSYWRQRGVD